MIIISRQQMDTLNAQARGRQMERVLALLTARFAGLPGAADTDALRTAVVQAIEDGRPLGFRLDEDTARLAMLWLLPESLRHHPLAASVMIRILNNVELSPAERLDFIDAQVVHRQPGR